MTDYRKQKAEYIKFFKNDLEVWKKQKSKFRDLASQIKTEARQTRKQEIDLAISKEQKTIGNIDENDQEIDDIIYMLGDAIKKETYNTPIQKFKRGVIVTGALASFFMGGVYYNNSTIDDVIDTQNSYASQNIEVAKAASVEEYRPTVEAEETNVSETSETVATPKDYWYFPVRGDTLFGIAKDVSGRGENWRKIKNYNNLSSDQIEVNQPLRIPSEFARNTDHLFHGSLEGKCYLVNKHDTWNSISRRLYGSEDNSHILIAHNRKYNPRFSTKLWNKQYVLVPG